jgi:hypothetical protein
VSWAEFFEVATVITQLVLALLVAPACIVASVILVSRLIKLAAEELS